MTQLPHSRSNLNPLEFALLLGVTTIFAVLFFPAFRWVAAIVLEQDDYSHGLLLLPIAVWLAWKQQAEFFSRPLHGGVAIGVALFFVAAFFTVGGILVESLFAIWVGAFFCASGLLYWLTGSSRAPLLLAPLWLLFLAKPFPDALSPLLFSKFQSIAAELSVSLLHELRIPAAREGNIIELAQMTLFVEEACSGIRSLLALVTAAAVLSLIDRTSLLRTVVLLTIAAGLAIGMNIVRVATTAVLAAEISPETAEGFFHSFSGMIVFLIGFLLLAFINRMLNRGHRS